MFNQVLYTMFISLVTILTHGSAQTTPSAIDSSLERHVTLFWDLRINIPPYTCSSIYSFYIESKAQFPPLSEASLFHCTSAYIYSSSIAVVTGELPGL